MSLNSTYGLLANAPVPLLASLTDSTFDALLAGLPSGAVVEIPQGVTISLGAAHTLTQMVTIQGKGKLLDTRATPTSAFLTIGPAASGTKILCPLAGSVGGTYVANHHGIAIMGTDNGAGVAPTFVTDVVVKSPEVSGFGSMAVYGEFVQDAILDIDHCRDLGYAGIIIASAQNVGMRIRLLHDLTPGTAGNSYGMNYGRRDATSDLVRYPHSKNSFAYIDVMYNAPLWDGLGVHGGDGIYLGYGTLYGVKHAFDIVGVTDASGLTGFAPNNIIAVGGFADSGVTDGSAGAGINIAGAYKTGVDTLGAPTEYAKGINVTTGTLRGYGPDGDTTQGAVYCHSTQGLVLDAGNIREASPYAVCMYHDNKNFTIKGVQAMDPWTTLGVVAGIVTIPSTYNTGWILSASGTRGAKSATYVNNRGLYIVNDASNVIKLGVGADFSSATTPIVGPVASPFGTVILAPNGSVSAPAFSFGGDPDTGIFNHTANDLGFAAGGTMTAHMTATSLFLSDGVSIAVGGTAGTMIGAGATSKLGFYGKTPIVQRVTTAPDATDLASAIALVNELKADLRALGFKA